MHSPLGVRYLLILALGWTGLADACSTPVFRYALENWEPDMYVLEARLPDVVPADLRAALDDLKEHRQANVIVREGQAADQDAGLTLRFPNAPPTHPPVLVLPATAANLASILDSPVRGTLAKQLLAGDTAVFLFLESGNAENDQAVRERLERTLRDLEKNLELPAQDPTDTLVDDTGAAPDLTIRFSIIPVKRDDPQERVLVETLLATEPDLRELKGPMVFPVFGRGRALYAIVDKGVNAEILYEAGAFLTGACSCQVKAQNPGVDLPLTANWEALFKDVVYQEVELPPLTAVSVGGEEDEPPAPGDLNETPAAVPAPAPPPPPATVVPLVLPLTLLALVAFIGSLVLMRRKPR